MSVLGVAAHMVQRLYERGMLSYPRSRSRASTEVTVDSVHALAARHGVAIDRALARGEVATGAENGHEAVSVRGRALTDINLDMAEWVLSPEDAALQRVARHTVRCGLELPYEVPEVSRLPDWARDLEWSRLSPTVAACLATAEEARPVAGMTIYEPEEIALRGLLAAGLGRPSSIVAHSRRFAERGYVDEHGLTERAHALAAEIPQALLDPAFSRGVEQVLAEDDASEADSGDPESLQVAGLVARALQLEPQVRVRVFAALREANRAVDADETSATPVPVRQKQEDSRPKRLRPRLGWAWEDEDVEDLPADPAGPGGALARFPATQEGSSTPCRPTPSMPPTRWLR